LKKRGMPMRTALTLTSKEWTEVEKYQLWIIGHLNVPLEIASRLFHRSPNALCKAMARYRIRPSGTVRPGPKSAAKQKAEVMVCEIAELFTDGGFKYCSQPTPSADMSSKGLPEPLQSSLQRYGLTCNPPWTKRALPSDENNPEVKAHFIMAARVDAPRANHPLPWQTAEQLRERKRLAKTLAWVLLDDIVASLRGEGLEVIKDPPESYALHKRRYVLKGQRLTAAQLVMEFNKRRLEKGLEPLLVCEVTE
jgi:hypothetical protein